MSRENTYRGSGGASYATSDFWGTHFGNLPRCACIFEREKITLIEKKIAQSIRLEV